MIRLGYTQISENNIASVTSLLRRGCIGQSEYIEEFEYAFSKWIGSKYCVAVSSGTMADTIAMAVLKHFYPNKKKVVLPALTFAAHLNSVIHNGLTPVFVDVDQQLNINMQKAVEICDQDVLCLFPVHLLGRVADIPRGGNYKGVRVIEDSCEAMGALGQADGKCGTMGDMGTFSFFPSHTMTTGEGGMIVTDNKEFADMARKLRNHGKNSGVDFHFDVIGYNGKMTSIQAVLGIEALKDVDESIKKRREAYFKLGGTENAWEKVSPHAFPVICESKEERDYLLYKLASSGVECRNLFSCLPTQEKAYSFLGHKIGEFPQAEAVGEKGLYVPCHQGLTEADILKIKNILGSVKIEA